MIPTYAERSAWQVVVVAYFAITATRLLIVPPDFFIQRGAGEVAEWSKALPC
jgi:hypothetical protein